MPRQYPLFKTCVICGVMMQPHSYEDAHQFRKRVACSRKCGAAYASRNRKRLVVPESRTCAACGAAFTRQAHEDASGFLRRRSCSKECSYVLTWKDRRAALPDKTCPICGVVFEQRPGEETDCYRKRRTCSRVCGHKLRASERAKPEALTGTKGCVICGELFGRRAGELSGNYRTRLTCSRECANEQISRAQRMDYNVTAQGYPSAWRHSLKRRIRERDGNICQRCGTSPTYRALDVHHIDGDKFNLDEDNLITLCQTCHRFLQVPMIAARKGQSNAPRQT